MVESRGAVQAILSVAVTSRLVRVAGLIALLAAAALSLRISFTNAFVYINWADALSYAEGARRVFAGQTPYTEMQLAGPYPIDHASFGFGFVYPPTGAYLLAPFMLGENFWYAWNALSFFAVVGVTWLIVRRELGGLSALGGVAVGAIAVILFQPGLTDLKTGYLSPMVAAAFGSMWLWPRWSAVPALLFGLVKVFPTAGILWTIRKGGAWKGPVIAAIALFGALTLLHPTYLTDWVMALINAESGCPEFALWSFQCLGIPIVGYALAAALLVGAWRAKQDDVSFLSLGLAVTLPLPDVYWGNLMVPVVAATPLVLRLFRHSGTTWSRSGCRRRQIASSEATRQAESGWDL